jgi:transposase
MARVSKLVDQEVIEKASKGLKELGNYGKLSVKLKAVIACGDNSITQVSKIFNISRFTLNEWIKSVKFGGVSDLSLKPGRGRNVIVPESCHHEIKSWILEDSQLTTDDVVIMIKNRFNLNIGRTATYNLIKKLGLSYITPRPSHYKKDESLHDTFKKTSKKVKTRK